MVATMRRFLAPLAFGLLLAALPLSAHAGPAKHKTTRLGDLLSAATLDVPRSFALPQESALGFATLVLYLDYVFANVGNITTTCTASPDNNTTDYDIQNCTVAAGVCTLNDASIFVKAVSGSKRYAFRVGIAGFRDIECTNVHSAGAGGDTLTATVELVAD